MKITPNGSTPTRRAPQDYFTGTVWQDPVIETPEPARLNAARVTFDPGARTHWHTHPLGRRCMCCRAAAASRPKAARCARSGPAT